jgi:hypothetical protein
MSDQQMEGLDKDLRSVLDVLADLAKREEKLRRAELTEASLSGVPLDQLGDTSLRFSIEQDWAKLSPAVEDYLDKMRALLDRLLAYNPSVDTQNRPYVDG